MAQLVPTPVATGSPSRENHSQLLVDRSQPYPGHQPSDRFCSPPDSRGGAAAVPFTGAATGRSQELLVDQTHQHQIERFFRMQADNTRTIGWAQAGRTGVRSTGGNAADSWAAGIEKIGVLLAIAWRFRLPRHRLMFPYFDASSTASVPLRIASRDNRNLNSPKYRSLVNLPIKPCPHSGGGKIVEQKTHQESPATEKPSGDPFLCND